MTEFTPPLFGEEIKDVYEQVLKRVNLVKSTHSAKQFCIGILKHFRHHRCYSCNNKDFPVRTKPRLKDSLILHEHTN